MARTFTAADSEYAETDSAPLAGVPVTLACWFKPVTAANQHLIWVGDKDTANNYIALHMTSTRLRMRAISASASANATAAAPNYSTATWQHAAGVSSAVNSRAVYMNGASKGTDTTSVTPVGFDRIAVGRSASSSPGFYLDSSVQDAVVYSADLSDSEILSLAERTSPLLIQPANLVAYYTFRLDGDNTDWFHRYDLTAFNTPSDAASIGIIYPKLSVALEIRRNPDHARQYVVHWNSDQNGEVEFRMEHLEGHIVRLLTVPHGSPFDPTALYTVKLESETGADALHGIADAASSNGRSATASEQAWVYEALSDAHKRSPWLAGTYMLRITNAGANKRGIAVLHTLL